MNLSIYPTLTRDIPAERAPAPRTAAQDMAAGQAHYGHEWITPERLRAIRKAKENTHA